MKWANNPSGKVVGWALGLDHPELYDHQHWFIRQDGQNRSFSIQNIGSGKVLELTTRLVRKSTGDCFYLLKSESIILSTNGGQPSCSIRDLTAGAARTRQEWLLKEQNDGWFM